MNSKLITYGIKLVIYLLVFVNLHSTQADSEDLSPRPIQPGSRVVTIITDELLHQNAPIPVKFELLEDQNGQLSITDLSSPDLEQQFELFANGEIVNKGSSLKVFWVRVRLYNSTDSHQDMMLELGYPLLDYVTIYQFNSDGSYKQHHTGDMLPFSTREIAHRYFIFKTPLAPQENKLIYLRLSSKGNMEIQPRIFTKHSLSRHNYFSNLLLGIYYGIIIAMFLYNAVIFIITRDTTYFYYIMYIFSILFLSSVYNGLSLEFFWPEHPLFNNMMLPFLIGSGAIWCILFTRRLLNTKTNLPRIDLILRLILYFEILVISLIPFTDYYLQINVSTFMVPPICITIILCGVIMIKNGSRQARIFIAAWTIFLLGAVLQSLKLYFSFVPLGFASKYGLQLGNIIEVILLSLALGDRINELKQEKIAAENEALQNRVEMERRLTQTQKIEAMGVMAGGISHDFNNLLTVIQGYAELIMFTNTGNPQVKLQAERIINTSDDAKNIIKQILTFSRKRELDLKPVDPVVILKETLPLINSSAGERIEVKINLPDNNLFILADATQFKQVVLNLCNNAKQAIGNYDGRLTIEVKKFHLNSELSNHNHQLPRGNYVKLVVSDTGHGISEDILQNIFNPYFTTKKEGEGTGLGLAVVHGIVLTHGGDIFVSSTPGVGTTFEVLFPELNCSENVESENHLSHSLKGNEKILYVEDRPEIIELFSQAFISMGCKFTGVQKSSEALRLIEKNPTAFDIVITDFFMPEMTGLELSSFINRLNPSLPIILTTGTDCNLKEETLINAGISALIKKPFTIEKLKESVYSILKNKYVSC